MSTETGLPDVGSRYFWRIKRWNYSGSGHSLIIQLRERRWYGSRKVEDGISKHTPSDIISTCHFILRRSAEQRAKLATISDRDLYVGDYPPKTLPKGTR